MPLTDTTPKESPNTLHKKPHYTAHRRAVTTPDSANLATLYGTDKRGIIDVSGFDSIHGWVVATGGTITLQPLEAVKYFDNTGAPQEKFVARGSNIGPLADGATFELLTPGGGRWYFRVDAFAGSDAEVFLAGALRANEGSIY